MGSPSIRRGLQADAANLAELAGRTFQEAFGADNRPEDLALHLASAYGLAQQTRELADPNITTLVVEVEEQLVGYAQLRAGPAPECVTGLLPLELWRFYIAKPWHGRGLAQALMDRVCAEAHQRGASSLWLGVWERNERAKAFYRKSGFVDVGSQVFMVGTDAQTDRILVRPVRIPNAAQDGDVMAKVTGIGGVFFKSKGDHAALAAWYQKHLGMPLEPWGGAALRWPEDRADDKGVTAWHVAKPDTKWFAPSDASFMINYRVDNLTELLANLRVAGVEVLQGPESHENGKFAWIVDPDGNKIELWEPKLWDEKNKAG